jgi:DHA1 family tetracycline resistance protein-like MFS transporter
MAVYPFGPTYSSYFILSFLMAFGTSLINPSITSLTSQAVGASEQGATLGLSQGLGSLARALGPLCGLTVFEIWRGAPFWVAALVYALLIFGAVTVWRKAPPPASTSRAASV